MDKIKKQQLQQIIREEIKNTLNEEFDDRLNKFSSIFLKTFNDINNHEITFDEATNKLFAWIKANFK